MNSIVQTVRKPYDFVVRRLHLKSETQKHVSPSESSVRTNVFTSILSPFETYVVSFQSLLIWERPFVSAAAFVSINILYWLIVSWNRRLFSILSIFGVVWFGYSSWINQIWPEIRVPPEEEDSESWTALNPGVLSVPEVSRYLNDFCEKMLLLWKDVWKLRKENHGLFCALMCGFFSLLALIGKVIPGVLLIYTLVLLLSLGPGIALHLIPSTLYEQLIGFFSESDSQVSTDVSKRDGNSDKDSDIEEFVPETSTEVLRQLSLQDEVPEIPSPGMVLTESGEPVSSSLLSADMTINEADELSLYQGLGAFPSVEEENESDLEDAISESDIMPSLESENNEMHFVPTHFKQESSESESEAVFTEGLSFAKKDDGTGNPEKAANTEGDKKDIAKRKRSSSSDLDDDDDLADFEILEESDIIS